MVGELINGEYDVSFSTVFEKILHSLVITLWALCMRLVAEGATGNNMQPLYLRITGAVKGQKSNPGYPLKKAILRLSTDDYAGSQKGSWPRMLQQGRSPGGGTPWSASEGVSCPRTKAKPDGHVRRKKQHAQKQMFWCLDSLHYWNILALDSVPFREKSPRIRSQKVVF